MNVLRQIAIPENGKLWIDVPKEMNNRAFEVIVLPIENFFEKENRQVQIINFLKTHPADEPAIKDAQKLMLAHQIIDAGVSIDVPNDYLRAFEESKHDRTMPFRA